MAANQIVTGAWTQLLSDWLDQEQLVVPQLRARLDSLRPTDTLPMARWQQWLAEAVAYRPGLPAVGLSVGAGVKPRHLGLLGYLVLTCRTLGEAMQAYQRYESLFYGRNLVESVIEDATVVLRWPAEVATGELADSVSMAALVTFLRQLLAAPLPATPAPSSPLSSRHLSSSPASAMPWQEALAPSAMTFAFQPLSHQAEAVYAAFFDCPVDFDCGYTSIRFPLAYLQRRLPHSDPHLRRLLDRQAEALLAAQPGLAAFPRLVQQTLVSCLPEGRASLVRVARELHFSTRTLQRRLLADGSHWQQLLDDTRRELARHYLRDVSLTLSDIAMLLGFSEQSAFNRAYRRWTGETPARARRELP